MNTTAAATQAGVTVATIRTWCRRGVVAADKVAGRWIIDPASLARRIEIGARRMPQKPVELSEAVLRNIATARYEYAPHRADKEALAGRYVLPRLQGIAVWREKGLVDEIRVNGRRHYVLSEKAVRIRATITSN
ncbi:hypothetical protein [Streptomyces griseosporeus]|uniref:hypothetical protein n=1 Tax=Streptomyces griseosporeus TaxID=1910 RepID=UPI0036F742B6